MVVEPMSAAALGALITSACLAFSTCLAVCFKGMSHSRCSHIDLCCMKCDRQVMPEEEIKKEDEEEENET